MHSNVLDAALNPQEPMTLLHAVNPTFYEAFLREFYPIWSRTSFPPQKWTLSSHPGIYTKAMNRSPLTGECYGGLHCHAYHQDYTGGQLPILYALNPNPTSIWSYRDQLHWEEWLRKGSMAPNSFTAKQVKTLKAKRFPWHSEYYRDNHFIGAYDGFAVILLNLDPVDLGETKLFIPRGSLRHTSQIEVIEGCLSTLEKLSPSSD